MILSHVNLTEGHFHVSFLALTKYRDPSQYNLRPSFLQLDKRPAHFCIREAIPRKTRSPFGERIITAKKMFFFYCIKMSSFWLKSSESRLSKTSQKAS